MGSSVPAPRSQWSGEPIWMLRFRTIGRRLSPSCHRCRPRRSTFRFRLPGAGYGERTSRRWQTSRCHRLRTGSGVRAGPWFAGTESRVFSSTFATSGLGIPWWCPAATVDAIRWAGIPPSRGRFVTSLSGCARPPAGRDGDASIPLSTQIPRCWSVRSTMRACCSCSPRISRSTLMSSSSGSRTQSVNCWSASAKQVRSRWTLIPQASAWSSAESVPSLVRCSKQAWLFRWLSIPRALPTGREHWRRSWVPIHSCSRMRGVCTIKASASRPSRRCCMDQGSIPSRWQSRA